MINNQTKIINLEFKNTVHQFKSDIEKGVNSHVTEQAKSLENSFNRILDNSARKGQIGEIIVYNWLRTNYPNVEVTEKEKPHGADIHMVLPNLSKKIIIEVKHYSKTVDQTEIDKFLRDVSTTNSHGIMISLQNKIRGKQDGEVDFQNGAVISYISNGQSQMHLIRSAIDNIIKCANVLSDETHKLSKHTLTEIEKQFKLAKDNQKEMIKHLNDALKLAKHDSFDKLHQLIFNKLQEDKKMCLKCNTPYKNKHTVCRKKK